MEKEFITHELALRMKALGFDEPCAGFFDEGFLMLQFIRNGKIFNMSEDSCLAPVHQQAFKFLIPLQDEFKVCLDENGWYIYNLENEMYEQDALEKMIEIVEQNKK